MGKARKHHFIQRAHLALFESNSSELYVHSKENTSFKSSAKKLFAQRDLYSTKHEDKVNVDFESTLNDIEEKTFPVISQIAETGHIANEKRDDLNVYMALAFLRNPTFQSTVMDIHRNSVNCGIDMIERFGGLEYKKIKDDAGLSIRSSKMLEEGEYEIDINNLEYLKAFCNEFETVVKLISGYNFVVVRSPSGRVAIGDQPFTFFHPGVDFGVYGVPICSGNCEITFPISKEFCLVGKWQTELKKSSSEVVIKMVNLRQAIFASRFVAGQKRIGKREAVMKKYANAAFGSDVSRIPTNDGYITIVRQGIFPRDNWQKFKMDVWPIKNFL